MRSSVQTIDYIVLVCYLLLMAGVGAFFMRFMRVGADFLKGGNRVEWWVAGMASFMSGFSVWTFTGGAGFAYRQGVIGVFLMALAVPAFFFGYIVFAQCWRRSRVTTVVEYIRSRFGDAMALKIDDVIDAFVAMLSRDQPAETVVHVPNPVFTDRDLCELTEEVVLIRCVYLDCTAPE